VRSVGVDQSWVELVGRVQAGDERAFAVLWRRHHPSLVRYLEIVAGAGRAEDLAAETWISVVRTLPRFRGDEAGFKSLLFTTARSRLVDASRRARVRPVEDPGLDGIAEPAGVDAASPIERGEETQAALALIARLPAGQAEVVALRVIGGLDNSEVAAVVGKASGAVRVAYSRGIATLARLVAADSQRDALEERRVTDPEERAFR
jgi:RNA polymerase sigma-70 factor (ECF subfamily)